METWKEIKGYEGFYEISSEGRIKSLKRADCKCRTKDRLLTPERLTKGYLRVRLGPRNESKKFLVHRLVAEAFIPNPDNLPFINHKNEIKTDNRVENLEWCDNDYNVHYGSAIERKIKSMQKRCCVMDSEGNILKEFSSVKEAAQFMGVDRTTISHFIKHGRKSNRKSRRGNIKIVEYGYNWKLL